MAHVRVKHLRQAGICVAGAKAFCDRHGLDWREFCKHGMDSERAKHIDDAQMQRVIREAEFDA